MWIKSRATAAVREAIARAAERVRLASDTRILVALSGGPDSVALTHALVDSRSHTKFNLVAAHLNHRVRGAEADRDEAFVRELCATLEVDLITERAEKLTLGSSNFEERARTARRVFLNRSADQIGAHLIAVAHHADDQAETVLMRLLRGSGTAGLAAMAERGPGLWWRPLLTVSRAEIMNYLHSINTTWVDDSTNGSSDFLRNRIRHELLPLLEREYAPGVTGRLTELAGEMRTENEYIHQAAAVELVKRTIMTRLDLGGFARLPYPVATELLRLFVRNHIGSLRRLARDHISAMMRLCVGKESGGRVVLPGGWQLRRNYDHAVLEPLPTNDASAANFNVMLNLCGTTCIESSGFVFEARRLVGSAKSDCTRLEPTEALFDLDHLRLPLVVRNFQSGDRIAPIGLEGTRKLQDIFVDRKLVRSRRRTWPLVIADDKVIWVPGMARSRVALVTPSTTRLFHLRAFSSS